MMSALLSRTRDRSDAILEKKHACIVCSMSSLWLPDFAALLKTMDRSNTKLGEGVKHLF